MTTVPGTFWNIRPTDIAGVLLVDGVWHQADVGAFVLEVDEVGCPVLCWLEALGVRVAPCRCLVSDLRGVRLKPIPPPP